MTTPKPASPLPWRAENGMVQYNVHGQHDMCAGYSIVADAWDRHTDDHRAQDAAYIVLAANAFPKLVEALEHAESALEEAIGIVEDQLVTRGHAPSVKWLETAVDKAREALALAKGESK